MADEDALTYDGTALPLEESHEVANAFPTHVILLMGEKDAGKTTLLAEIHNAYLNAPFAGHLFAGSRTLIGFERLCFLSRFESGQPDEDTERTKSADIKLFHLALARETEPNFHTHLLLTDVSGERFKEIRSSVEEARELSPLVRRADHIVLLIDGDRLTVAKTQMATQTNALTLLRGLSEAGGLDNNSSLHVVIGKWDFIVARRAEEQTLQFEQSLRRATGTIQVTFHHVAARVTNPVDVVAGFGLDGLIKAWTQRVANSPPSPKAAGDADAQRRWFERYIFPRNP